MKSKKLCWLAKNITNHYDVWVVVMHHQGLCQNIVTLPFIKSLKRSYMANSSYYQRWLVNRKIYPRVWLKDCLFLLIEKAAAMIYISLSIIDLQGWYKSVKITINTPGFAKVIFDIIIYYHCFSSLVVTNKGTFYFFQSCYYYTIFYISNIRYSYSTTFYL